MNLVPVSEIPMPPAINAVGLDDLINTYKLCKQMEVLCSESNGIGLSAVQVGIPLKLFVVNFKDHYEYFINCEYSAVDNAELVESIEGCLSLPDRFFVVKRHPAVHVKGYRLSADCKLETFEGDFKGLYAIVVQHEIDHHNGVMIDTIGKEYLISPRRRRENT